MGRVTAVVNQKGGVGKTTTTLSLGAYVAEKGFRVLILDIDSQGNATSGLGVDRRQLTHCIYDVLTGLLPIQEVILSTAMSNLEVVPSTLNLAGLEVELAREDRRGGERREYHLSQAIKSIVPNYDLILIDSPPSLGLLTINALTAADGVLIPVQSEYYALEGLSQLLHTISLVQRHLNPRLQIDGAAITMHDARTNLSRQVAAEVRKFFGPKAFQTMIPRSVRLAEAPSYGETINRYAGSSLGAQAYRALAEEMIQRLGLAQQEKEK